MIFPTDSCGRTDVGLRRNNNEDIFHTSTESDYFLVSDGMGGAAAGEIASRTFLNAANRVIAENSSRSEEQAVTLVKKVFAAAHEEIREKANQNPAYKGMGCTAELLVFHTDGFVLGHIGDSRTYRLRQDVLKQLTKDHSLVQEQINMGIITSEQARHHKMRNIILRALGINEEIALDVVKGKLYPGDLFLLCSDGLTDMISDDSIASILNKATTLPQKALQLINEAKNAGGLDNVTVVLVEVSHNLNG
jgi:protein phosphatase